MVDQRYEQIIELNFLMGKNENTENAILAFFDQLAMHLQHFQKLNSLLNVKKRTVLKYFCLTNSYFCKIKII